jgi:hypothetical protein
MLFDDSLIRQKTGFFLYTPGVNFITADRNILDNLENIPKGVIVSPLYITLEHFTGFTADEDYRAFYITRDPRDIVVSSYFSLRYSHAARADYVRNQRRELERLSEEDGIAKLIGDLARFLCQVMLPWRRAGDPRIRVFRYEDVFGPGQLAVLGDIVHHCQLALASSDRERLAEKYAFKRISGRNPGAADHKKHYRKGISGDWRNYFTKEHKNFFKQEAGELLIELGYETDADW